MNRLIKTICFEYDDVEISLLYYHAALLQKNNTPRPNASTVARQTAVKAVEVTNEPSKVHPV